MGARSSGLLARRAYTIDANTVLVGAVLAGTRGRAAETRTGSARLLNTRLEAQDVFKVVTHGQTSDSAGGYIIKAAHVAEGKALSDATGWATIATVTCAPGISEIPVSGVQIRDAVKTAGSLTGDVRVVAIRAVAGTGTGNGQNGVVVPAGTNTVSLQTDCC